MINSKFDLYNAEWLDLVFNTRNKAYGAYELRQHYGVNMVKAMGIAFTTVVAAALLYGMATRHVTITDSPLDKDSVITIRLTDLKPPKIIEEPKPASVKPQTPVSTKKLTSFVVTSKPVTENPPIIKELTGAIGPANVISVNSGPEINVPIEGAGGQGTAVTPAASNEPVSRNLLEVQPEPVGGAAAWTKFLSRNLRFPPQAQDAGVGGRVLVSFVIEKDGSLSNIVVEKGAGYGMDEEALRVLKLAKAWKPGIQNGQPVRVRYTIPLNFQLTE
jgi:protein TonB